MTKFLENLSLNLFPTIAGVCITLCYVPQLLMTYNTKNVQGQSLAFWLILDIALLGFFFQQLGLFKYKNAKNHIGVLVQFLNLLFAIVMTCFVILWR